MTPDVGDRVVVAGVPAIVTAVRDEVPWPSVVLFNGRVARGAYPAGVAWEWESVERLPNGMARVVGIHVPERTKR